ncbi:MAG: YjfI family protein [Gammaproteobacteria bacterium]|nr:YjfI family protein [Gammaproteobacteria bacterium]
MSNEKLEKLKRDLTKKQLADGTGLSIEMFDGENTVACIKVEDREEFPIYMTVDDGQILCISYLFGDDLVHPDKRAALAEAMLMMNVSIPLSAFSKIGDQYIMFGALSPHASIDELLLEIELLSDNVLEAIDAVSDYLKEAA